MLSETLTLKAFADLFQELTAIEREDLGGVLVVNGWHPLLGELTAVQFTADDHVMIFAAADEQGRELR